MSHSHLALLLGVLHRDAAITSFEDNFASPKSGWTGLSVSGGVAHVQPSTTGSNLFTTPAFDAWTGDVLDGWGELNESPPDREIYETGPDGAAGSGAGRFVASTGYVAMRKTGFLSASDFWHRYTIDITALTTGNHTIRVADDAVAGWASVGSKEATFPYGAAFDVFATSGADFVLDNGAIYALTDLYGVHTLAPGTAWASVKITAADGYQAGVVHYADADNLVEAVIFPYNDKIRLYKNVGGTRTPLAVASATYGAGYVLKLERISDGTTVWYEVSYNGVKVCDYAVPDAVFEAAGQWGVMGTSETLVSFDDFAWGKTEELDLSAYTMYDLFISDLAVGSVDGSAPSPRAGGLTREIEYLSNDVMAISNGELTHPGGGASSASSIHYGAQSRVNGLAFLMEWKLTRAGNFHPSGGFANSRLYGGLSADSELMFFASSNSYRVIDNTSPSCELGLVMSDNTVYRAIAVASVTGVLMFQVSPTLRLIWASVHTTADPIYPLFFARDKATSLLRTALLTLTGNFAAGLYGFATVNETSFPLSGDAMMDADSIIDYEFALPGSPSGGETVDLYYRKSAADTYWHAYLSFDGAQWDFDLDSVSGGTPTNRIHVDGVGTPDTIRVIADGTYHNCYTAASGVWTKRGGEINVSHQDTATGLNIGGDATPSRLASWPRTSSEYDVLENY